MKIKFLRDYIGRETAMKQYRKGDVETFDHQAALELIGYKVAVEVVEEVVLDVTVHEDEKPKSVKYHRKVNHGENS